MAEQTKNRSWLKGEGLVVLLGIIVVIGALIVANLVGVNLIHGIQHLESTMIYVVIALLVFAEAAIFLGFVIPGEAAVIIGGVLASGNHVSLPALCIVVVAAAILGDSAGYWIGHRFGERLLSLSILDRHRVDLDRGLSSLHKRGAAAVFVARFVAFLRAVMPGLAGASHMPYQRFFAANALGGLIWGVGFTLIGWGVGYSFHQAELVAVWLSLGLLVGIIIIAGAVFLGGRKAEIDAESAFESSTTDTEATLNAELSEVRDQMEHHSGDADGGEATPAT